MSSCNSVAFFVGFYVLSFSVAFTSCVEKWNMHERCGQHIEGYGGQVHFDSRFLPHNTATCTVTITGKGTEDYMLSLYFTSFNVSSGCMANITLREDSQQGKGLYQSFCTNNPYLNPFLIFTTNSRFLSLVYTRRILERPVTMNFTIKYVTFASRVSGCTDYEMEYENMFSCRNGRCVHSSLVCQDLNPCGDNRDCYNKEALQQDGDGKGLNFVKIVILLVVMVFAVFAIIQICLVVRNEHHMCSWKDPKVRIEAELMTVSNGEVKSAETIETITADHEAETDSGTASEKDAATDNLLTRELA